MWVSVVENWEGRGNDIPPLYFIITTHPPPVYTDWNSILPLLWSHITVCISLNVCRFFHPYVFFWITSEVVVYYYYLSIISIYLYIKSRYFWLLQLVLTSVSFVIFHYFCFLCNTTIMYKYIFFDFWTFLYSWFVLFVGFWFCWMFIGWF